MDGEGAGAKSVVCWACLHKIPVGARKCTKCDSFQDWRGRIGVSATVLSMLTAFVATCVTAIPVIRAASATHDSDLNFYLSDGPEGNVLHVIAINRGDRPGILEPLWITSRHKIKGVQAGILMRPVGKTPLIEPGKAMQLTFLPEFAPDSRVQTVARFNQAVPDECEINFAWRSFRGALRSTRTPINCGAVFLILYQASPPQEQ